jgi:exopolyphosphatase/guanosine-5'-triphosphate,3'-diphosphate pyrophosphatase
MKRHPLAVIDIGSNTIRSLVVEVLPGGTYRVLDDEREVARLASGLNRRGCLSAEAIRRAVVALKRMAEIARARGARRMSVLATSAIRNATNRRAFLDRVRLETGLRVRVISEAEEARLAFESAAQSFDLGEQPCAVADVGGGSTELILALGTHIQQEYSLRLGAVALTEQFLLSDPVRNGEFRKLRREVRRRLRAAKIAAAPPPQFIVASGGSATAVAQLAMARHGLERRSAQGFEITQAELLHLRRALLRRTLAERRQMPGLSPDRADIIIAGVTILYEILDHLKVNVLRISERGIRHAALNRMIARASGTAASGPPNRPDRLAAVESFARSLHFEEKHCRQVRRVAESLFDQMAEPLGIDPAARDLVGAAALLHNVGYIVSYRQHHKHTYRLVAHAQLDGFTPREREIIALTARFHRRSGPKRKHRAWAALPPDDRDLVARLAAMVRLADALDRRHSQRLLQIRCRVARKRILLTLASASDLGVEIHAAEAKARVFEKTFGRALRIRAVRVMKAARSGPALRLLRPDRRAAG